MSSDAFTISGPLRDFYPRVGLVLGSGLSGFTQRVEVAARVPYRELALPQSGV